MNIFDDWGIIKNPSSTIATGAPPIPISGNITEDGASDAIAIKLGQEYNVYGYGTFGGATVTVEWSADLIGVNWVGQTSGSVEQLRAGVFEDGLFVVVGNNGEILTSPDAITWTSQTSGVATDLVGITFGNGIFIVVGTGGEILTSPDAITWTPQTSGTGKNLGDVEYAGGLFVVCGDDATILASPDGITWNLRPIADSRGLNSITSGYGLYVIVGSTGLIVTSPLGDAITWTEQKSPFLGDSQVVDIVFSGEKFLAVSSALDESNIMISSDGIDWQLAGEGVVGSFLFAVGFSYNTFLVAGAAGEVFTSTDALNWTPQESPNTQNIRGIFEGNDKIVLVGNGGVINTNTISWTTLKDAQSANVQFTATDVFNIPRIGAAIFLRTNTTLSSASSDVTVDLR